MKSYLLRIGFGFWHPKPILEKAPPAQPGLIFSRTGDRQCYPSEYMFATADVVS
ncbi:hypothetical protein [Microcoleus sp. AR_TQ3_B6]|uniref:hypothetical protein n=1 Tax=Microcoleus sp. AR_TQ3_B6 TaxID=3055284 RepID=UPI002FD2FE05